jgi:hypothetical protein
VDRALARSPAKRITAILLTGDLQPLAGVK